MSILCGHCGQQHTTVAEVRECSLRNPSHPYRADLQEFNHDQQFEESFPVPAPIPAVPYVEPGFYQTDSEHIYRVVMSQKGRPYAKILVGTQSGTIWEYAQGAMRSIRPEHRMSLEDVAKYGKLTGQCMVCGRELTNPESIERGIGPVCAENF